MPFLPSMRIAEYCEALARPKKTAHRTPLAATDKGKSIWANDMV